MNIERSINRQNGVYFRTAETIFDALIEDIVAGRRIPGEPLAELALAEHFGVSRTPVREALHRLEQAKLAERGPRRAFFVREMRSEELEDLFEAVGEVESALASLAAHRMDAAERRALESLVYEGGACATEPAIYGAINRRFHEAIKTGAHNATLAATLDDLNIRTFPWRVVNFAEDPRRIDTSRAEHRGITEAIVAGDVEATRQLMRAHVASSHAVAADLLARRGR